MNEESSTFEMETKNSFDAILKAIFEMRQSFENRLDKIENRLEKVETRLDKIEAEFIEYKRFSEIQFEAVRQGLVRNYNQSDQLVSEISQSRSVIYSVKADLGELRERVYLLSKSNENALNK